MTIPENEDSDNLPRYDFGQHRKCECGYANRVVMHLSAMKVPYENPDVEGLRIRFDMVCPACKKWKTHRLSFPCESPKSAKDDIETYHMVEGQFK